MANDPVPFASPPASPLAAPGVVPASCDVLVVGGGINGTGIARDLAGRGWSVVLAERDDLAAHTSSASTKLIHGGLRYLEHREFRLVRKALQERETLLRSAPHLMHPLRFVIPHDPRAAHARPAWLVRLGLFLYDHLVRREVLPGSCRLDLARHPAGRALRPGLSTGFAYWDGRVDDARLVVAVAQDAQARGATVLTRTPCETVRRQADGWHAVLRGADGVAHAVRARALVNAAGPWAARFLREATRDERGRPLGGARLRLVQGSHIVVPRRFDHDDAYLFQNDDGRVLFAIPWEREFTMIGTTDVELPGDPGDDTAAATEAEIDYLCREASRWFATPVRRDEVRHAWAGVRPLLEDDAGDAAAVTRDWKLESRTDGPPLLTVWGGKLTTFRRLAEEAGDTMGRLLGDPRPAWTAAAVLPGGDLSAFTGRAARSRTPQADFDDFRRAAASRWPWLPAQVRDRWAQAYGAGMARLVGQAQRTEDLGDEVAPGLPEAELRHLVDHEWARTAEDVLWRRGKLGLHLGPAERARVADWMRRHAGPGAVADDEGCRRAA